MKDVDCVRFLQWALPHLGMRWTGFRKVRRQVCKRIAKRMAALQLETVDAYRRRLSSRAEEWRMLDNFCRITVSRFHRDRKVFERLTSGVFVPLAQTLQASGEDTFRCWSIGCASGEEPYTVAILWRHAVAPRFPSVRLELLATDADPRMLQRSANGRYSWRSLKDLPEGLRTGCFDRTDDQYRLRAEYRSAVTFRRQDIREAMPEGRFHVILCRNLVFTYFAETLQRRILTQLIEHLYCGGWLVLGAHESLPEGVNGLTADATQPCCYRKPRKPPPRCAFAPGTAMPASIRSCRTIL